MLARGPLLYEHLCALVATDVSTFVILICDTSNTHADPGPGLPDLIPVLM
jgi:hypothetical protein